MTEKLSEARSLARLLGRVAVSFGAGFFVMALAPAAQGYVGPGAGLGVLGTLLAMIIAVLASVFGLVLWLWRMITRRKKIKDSKAGVPESSSDPS